MTEEEKASEEEGAHPPLIKLVDVPGGLVGELFLRRTLAVSEGEKEKKATEVEGAHPPLIELLDVQGVLVGGLFLRRTLVVSEGEKEVPSADWMSDEIVLVSDRARDLRGPCTDLRAILLACIYSFVTRVRGRLYLLSQRYKKYETVQIAPLDTNPGSSSCGYPI